MKPSDILNHTRAVPCRPFRITLNSGKSYDVRHLEMLNVTMSSLHYYQRPNPEEAGDRWETVSSSLVQDIVHIDAPMAAAG